MINTEFIRNNILTFGLELVSEKAILELLDHLKATEKERDWHAERCEDAMNECAALRARIEAMEQQEPIGTTGGLPGTPGFTMACFHADKVPVGTKLYALPGAKGEDK